MVEEGPESMPFNKAGVWWPGNLIFVHLVSTTRLFDKSYYYILLTFSELMDSVLKSSLLFQTF